MELFFNYRSRQPSILLAHTIIPIASVLNGLYAKKILENGSEF